jgi:hypothetical protein
MAAALSIGSLVGLLSCDSGREAESPDQMMTPASRFDTQGGPERAREPRVREPPAREPPAREPRQPRVPRSELDTEIESESDDGVPEPPSSVEPPIGGHDAVDRELNWVDDSGNTIE